MTIKKKLKINDFLVESISRVEQFWETSSNNFKPIETNDYDILSIKLILVAK